MIINIILIIIIINASRELLTHIYLAHFAAEAENNLRIENKKEKYKENTQQKSNNKKGQNAAGRENQMKIFKCHSQYAFLWPSAQCGIRDMAGIWS